MNDKVIELEPQVLINMYNNGATIQKMKLEIQGMTGETITDGNLRALFSELGLNLNKKPRAKRFALKEENPFGEITTPGQPYKAPGLFKKAKAPLYLPMLPNGWVFKMNYTQVVSTNGTIYSLDQYKDMVNSGAIKLMPQPYGGAPQPYDGNPLPSIEESPSLGANGIVLQPGTAGEVFTVGNGWNMLSGTYTYETPEGGLVVVSHANMTDSKTAYGGDFPPSETPPPWETSVQETGVQNLIDEAKHEAYKNAIKKMTDQQLKQGQEIGKNKDSAKATKSFIDKYLEEYAKIDTFPQALSFGKLEIEEEKKNLE